MQDKLRKFCQRPEKEILYQKSKSQPINAEFYSLESFSLPDISEFQMPTLPDAKKPLELKRTRSSFNLMKIENPKKFQVTLLLFKISYLTSDNYCGIFLFFVDKKTTQKYYFFKSNLYNF